MTVGELRIALNEFSDDEVVVVGIPWWECALTTNIQVSRHEKGDDSVIQWDRIGRSGHAGGILGCSPDADSLIVLTNAKD